MKDLCYSKEIVLFHVARTKLSRLIVLVLLPHFNRAKIITILFLLVILRCGDQASGKELYENYQECLSVNGSEANWLCEGLSYPKSRNDKIQEIETNFNQLRSTFTDEIITSPRAESENTHKNSNLSITEKQKKAEICEIMRRKKEYLSGIQGATAEVTKKQRGEKSDLSSIYWDLHNKYKVPFGYCSGHF